MGEIDRCDSLGDLVYIDAAARRRKGSGDNIGIKTITWSATEIVDGRSKVAEHTGLFGVAAVVADAFKRSGGPRAHASVLPLSEDSQIEEFLAEFHDHGAELVIHGRRDVVDAALGAVPKDRAGSRLVGPACRLGATDAGVHGACPKNSA